MITTTTAVERRTFLGRLGAAAAALGAAFGATTRTAAAAQAAPAATPFQPARHPEDDWYDQTPAKHRFFLDTASASGLSSAMGWARNFYEANASGYKLTDADLAQIICLRHHSTSFAFTDAMWAKYGAALSERAEYVDPATKQAPTANPYESESRGDRGITLSGLARRGTRYAVCSMATRRTASIIAEKTGGKVEDI